MSDKLKAFGIICGAEVLLNIWGGVFYVPSFFPWFLQ